ncbi:MAG: ATP-binding cassette domain-containing protein, partial [Oscillospiraceae bacterium]|nr:ATP-binding cassette domain-containing protein [Oscillospiraceae bacterium]
QGNLLLSGTLRENLTITRPEASEEEIAEALHVSALGEVLSQLPKGLETRLGEDGAGLSEGQAQRLAIARAVLSGAKVLLLDEVTSALDAETEKTVLARIRALEGRTCIAVTHRSAAEELVDWRLRVSERGIHTEKIGP